MTYPFNHNGCGIFSFIALHSSSINNGLLLIDLFWPIDLFHSYSQFDIMVIGPFCQIANKPHTNSAMLHVW